MLNRLESSTVILLQLVIKIVFEKKNSYIYCTRHYTVLPNKRNRKSQKQILSVFQIYEASPRSIKHLAKQKKKKKKCLFNRGIALKNLKQYNHEYRF